MSSSKQIREIFITPERELPFKQLIKSLTIEARWSSLMTLGWFSITALILFIESKCAIQLLPVFLIVAKAFSNYPLGSSSA